MNLCQIWNNLKHLMICLCIMTTLWTLLIQKTLKETTLAQLNKCSSTNLLEISKESNSLNTKVT